MPTMSTGQDSQDFLQLLGSLEDRLDMLAQIDHTQLEDGDTLTPGTPDGAYQDSMGSINPTYGTTSTACFSAQDLHLKNENAELVSGLSSQCDLISKLTGEIDEMRGRLHNFRTGGQQLALVNNLRCELSEAVAYMQKEHSQVHQLQWQVSERERREEQTRRERDDERVVLQTELRELQVSVMHQQLAAATDLEVTASALNAPSDLHVSVETLPQSLFPIVAPFSRGMHGANIVLSEDAYVATRSRGCRQSVVIGSAPLPFSGLGWYFEVEIRATVEGWIGGLGIGVTCTEPERLGSMPDKAWRVPQTFAIGYWGCIFLNGKEHKTEWRADTLKAGSRVGIHVSDDTGDVHVFTNGEPVVLVESAISRYFMTEETKYYPIVDVFAATLSVALNDKALPPPPPWDLRAVHLSPPDSPVSRLSVGRNK